MMMFRVFPGKKTTKKPLQFKFVCLMFPIWLTSFSQATRLTQAYAYYRSCYFWRYPYKVSYDVRVCCRRFRYTSLVLPLSSTSKKNTTATLSSIRAIPVFFLVTDKSTPSSRRRKNRTKSTPTTIAFFRFVSVDKKGGCCVVFVYLGGRREGNVIKRRASGFHGATGVWWRLNAACVLGAVGV